MEEPASGEVEEVDAAFLARFEACIDFLRQVEADRALLVNLSDAQRIELLQLTGRISMPDHENKKKIERAFRKKRRQGRKEADKQVIASTGLRVSQQCGGITEPFYKRPPPLLEPAREMALLESAAESPEMPPFDNELPKLNKPRACYCCNARYTDVHHFYASMCRDCGDFNFAKRVQTADLTGRVAIVTGGRVKIGFCIALKLLRANCHVVVVTRFARDAVVRFSREKDFDQWSARLSVHGVDLRHTPSVEAFCEQMLRSLGRLDYLIHNACQTVRRPTAFYRHMWKREQLAIEDLKPEEQAALAVVQGVMDPIMLAQIELLEEDHRDADEEEYLFPTNHYDVDMQQIDKRAVNSWKLELADVSSTEVIETHLCNAVAPFVMNSRLKPLMINGDGDRHIVNVSAMEGQFYKVFKTTAHPHTNMAKASLNMMTRTCAADYIRAGICMNSTDTGWVSEENPAPIAERIAENFAPPLDIIDGAARCLDPIFDQLLNGNKIYGKFLKNYRETDW